MLDCTQSYNQLVISVEDFEQQRVVMLSAPIGEVGNASAKRPNDSSGLWFAGLQQKVDSASMSLRDRLLRYRYVRDYAARSRKTCSCADERHKFLVPELDLLCSGREHMSSNRPTLPSHDIIDLVNDRATFSGCVPPTLRGCVVCLMFRNCC